MQMRRVDHRQSPTRSNQSIARHNGHGKASKTKNQRQARCRHGSVVGIEASKCHRSAARRLLDHDMDGSNWINRVTNAMGAIQIYRTMPFEVELVF